MNCMAVKTDISKGEEVRKLVVTVMDKFKKIDILVNNAGVISAYPLEETSEEVWDRVISVNLKGVFLCSMAVGKVMIEQKRGKYYKLSVHIGLRTYPRSECI